MRTYTIKDSDGDSDFKNFRDPIVNKLSDL